MTIQPSAQAFDTSALHVSTILADVYRAPPTDLDAAKVVIDQLARLLNGALPPQAKSFAPTTSQVQGPSGTGLALWKAKRVATQIEEQLGEPIYVRDLAERVGLSASHFSRAFKQSFGETTHLYILGRRIARAQTMMRETSLPLCEIALTCGFSDQAHMTRMFTAHVGTSPNRWRRAHQLGLQ